MSSRTSFFCCFFSMCFINLQRSLLPVSAFKQSQLVFHLSDLHLSRACFTSSVAPFQCLMLTSEGSLITSLRACYLDLIKPSMCFFPQNEIRCIRLHLVIDFLPDLWINFTIKLLFSSMSYM